MKLKYWTQKNGEEILISSMTNDHLMNTIKLLRRNAEALRANMCNEFREQEYDSLVMESTEELLNSSCPEYKFLIEEAANRRLI